MPVGGRFKRPVWLDILRSGIADGPTANVRGILVVPPQLTRHPTIVARCATSLARYGLALRHFYTLVLLDAGESIKAVSEYLGHSDPGFTLRTYTPDAEQRTPRAIDRVLGQDGSADGLDPAQESE